jgi:hypothetical protein
VRLDGEKAADPGQALVAAAGELLVAVEDDDALVGRWVRLQVETCRASRIRAFSSPPSRLGLSSGTLWMTL